ncbi:hypothetical protein MRB53_032216 [Persea americana]|uniref:Uncharacterized protein n=1 Tax=Persea americana TaxID=3435 RepID=A0ACC2KRC3_PERAE|nr:hypothetical protein MRB53_032216 [Persea americana]
MVDIVHQVNVGIGDKMFMAESRNAPKGMVHMVAMVWMAVYAHSQPRRGIDFFKSLFVVVKGELEFPSHSFIQRSTRLCFFYSPKLK